MLESRHSNDIDVLCLVGASVCALPLEFVVETMRALPTEHLAGVPIFIRGVSVVRGVPTPVVDAARLLGIDAASSPSRFVLLRIGERRAALAVDAVLGVQSLPPATTDGLPPLLGDLRADLVERLGMLDGRLLVVMRAAKIVPSVVWHALGAPAALP
jgi:purine-binding chemotaxis protein CheW